MRDAISIPMRIMIRLRDVFCDFTVEEISRMRQEVQQLAEIGVDGVVVGFLSAKNQFDFETLNEVLAEKGNLGVTIHRAFDRSKNPFSVLEKLVLTGLADRILTSGQAASALQGIDMLARLQHLAGDRIKLIAGGGITVENIATIARATEIDEFHVGRGCRTPATTDGVVDPEKVKKLAQALEKIQ